MSKPIFNDGMDNYMKLDAFSKKITKTINKAKSLSAQQPKKALQTLESYDKHNFLTKGDTPKNNVLDYKYEVNKFSPKNHKVTPKVISQISQDLYDNKTQNDQSYTEYSKLTPMSYKQRLQETEQDARDNKAYDHLLSQHSDTQIKGLDKIPGDSPEFSKEYKAHNHDLGNTQAKFLDHHPNLKQRLGLKTRYSKVDHQEEVDDIDDSVGVGLTPNRIRKRYTKPFEKEVPKHIARLKPRVKVDAQSSKIAKYLDQHPKQIQKLQVVTGKQLKKINSPFNRVVDSPEPDESISEDTDWSTKIKPNRIYERDIIKDPVTDEKTDRDFNGRTMLKPIQPKSFDKLKKQVPRSLTMSVSRNNKIRDHNQIADKTQHPNINNKITKGINKALSAHKPSKLNQSASSKLHRTFRSHKATMSSSHKSVSKNKKRVIKAKRSRGIQR